MRMLRFNLTVAVLAVSVILFSAPASAAAGNPHQGHIGGCDGCGGGLQAGNPGCEMLGSALPGGGCLGGGSHAAARFQASCFNCGCKGSYTFPVPPLYTYHWPGMYQQHLMTNYASPWRFPPIKAYEDDLDKALDSAGVNRFFPGVSRRGATSSVKAPTCVAIGWNR